MSPVCSQLSYHAGSVSAVAPFRLSIMNSRAKAAVAGAVTYRIAMKNSAHIALQRAA